MELSLDYENKKRWSLSILMATFLAALDSTVVGAISPTIANSLKGIGLYPWLLTAFMASTTISTPLFGKLADRISGYRLYNVALLLFMLGSLICSISTSMFVLLCGRFIQGIGAGGIFTLGLVLIGQLFEQHQRVKMQGLQSAMWGLASIVGPSLGGIVAQWGSWRFLFLINIPITILVMWLMTSSKSNVEVTNNNRIDYAGATWLVVFLFMVLTAPTLLQKSLHNWVGWLTLIVAVACLICFWIVEKRAKDPIVSVAAFRRPYIINCLSIGFLGSWILFTCVLLIPLLVQNVLQTGPALTGLILLPMPLGWAIGSIFSGKVLKYLTVRTTAMLGWMFLIVGLIGFLWGNRLDEIALCGLLLGIGMGFLIMSSLLTIQFHSYSDEIGSLTGLFNLFRNLGNAIGPAVTGGIAFILYAYYEPNSEMSATSDPVHLQYISQAIHQALWLPLVLGILMIPVLLRLPSAQITKKPAVTETSLA